MFQIAKKQELYIFFISSGACIQSILAMALYLPSMPLMLGELGLSADIGKLSVTAFIVAQTVAPLLLNYPADRYGFQTIILWVTGLFSVASFLCITTHSASLLLCCRLIQGACVQTAVSLGYAMVRTAGKQKAVHMLAAVALVQSSTYTIGPFLGGIIANTWGWQVNFMMMGVWGAIFLGAVLLLTPRMESSPAQSALNKKELKRLLTNSQFVTCSLLVSSSHFCTLVFFTLAPLYFFAEGLSSIWIGSAVGATSIGYMAGSFMLQRVSHAYTHEILLRGGLLTYSATGLCTLLAPCLAPAIAILLVVVMQCVFACAKAFIIPIAQVRALHPFQQHQAKISSVYNFISTAGGLLGAFLCLFIPQSFWVVFLSLCMMGSGLSFLYLLKRQ